MTGTGQVKLAREGTSDGLPASGIGFVDSALGQACSGIAAADGVTRCLPSATFVDSHQFADVACSLPLVVSRRTVDACPSQSDSWYSTVSSAGDTYLGASYRQHIYPRGEPYTGPLFVRPAAGDCWKLGSTSEQLPESDVFLLGPEVPPSQFAEVRYVRPADP